MTPPSTQNLKALGSWVFFLICCSTFSFLPNVELRLTLEYLRVSPLSVSPSSTLIHSPLSGSILNARVHYSWPLTCTTVHTLIRDTLAWNLIRKTFDTGSNCTRPSRKPMALIPLVVGRIREGEIGEMNDTTFNQKP